jgi:DNA processing protein
MRRLLSLGSPERVWSDLVDGTLPADVVVGRHGGGSAELVETWRRVAGAIDVDALLARHVDAGIGVAVRGSAAYPADLVDDDDPPSVLFWRGDIDALAGARVAIVGTRRASRYGIDIAHSMAADLAEAGVAVVSGLALGIDGAAHAGVISIDGAPPIGVVGSGLDHVYPRAHRSLWREVADRGVLLSEYPLGTSAHTWRFPARNRIIAALSSAVVVVESQITGGALGTAVEGARRGRPVLAVPGPVTAPGSAGTNQLLFDGCGPARDAADVLLAIGSAPSDRPVAAERRRRPTGDAATVLAMLPWISTTVDEVVASTALPLGHVVLALERLHTDRWVQFDGARIERVGRASVRP